MGTQVSDKFVKVVMERPERTIEAWEEPLADMGKYQTRFIKDVLSEVAGKYQSKLSAHHMANALVSLGTAMHQFHCDPTPTAEGFIDFLKEIKADLEKELKKEEE